MKQRFTDNVNQYFTRAASYPLPRLIIAISVFVEAKGVKLEDLPKDWGPNDINTAFDRYVTASIIAPLIETVIGQWIPIWFVGKFTKRTSVLIFCSTMFFLILHNPA